MNEKDDKTTAGGQGDAQKAEDEAQSSAARGNSAPSGSGASERRKLTHREKKAQLHEAFDAEIERSARQTRLSQGTATEEDARAEARWLQTRAKDRAKRLTNPPTQPSRSFVAP
jgi:hypothetical protein